MIRVALWFGSGVVSLVAQATFSSTVGLGSVLVAMLVVVMFGLFSFRERRNSGWKDLYEQKNERVEDLVEEKEAERVVRHAIKDELAQTKALLEIEKAKPDLSVILDKQQSLWSESIGQLSALLMSMQSTQQEMLDLLRDLKTIPGGTS